MSWTKRQVIERAFSKSGLRSAEYDIDPEEMQDALKELDLMMGVWESKNIRFGYPLHGNPDNSDLDESTNAPSGDVNAMILNLGLALCDEYAKPASAKLTTDAKSQYSFLLSRYNKPPNAARATMPSGAGNLRYGVNQRVFIRDEPLPSGIEPPADKLEFE